MTLLPRRTHRAIAVALTTAALLAACSKPTEAELEDRGHDAIEAVGIEIKAHWSEADKVKHKTAPEFTHLESHVVTWQDQALVDQVYVKVWNECLAQAGHKSRLSVGDLPEGAGSRGTFYGQPTLVHQDRGGFAPYKPWPVHDNDIPWKVDGAPATDGSFEELGRLVHNESSTGCGTTKLNAAYESFGVRDGWDPLESASDAAREKIRASHEVAGKDPAVKAAAGRWRDCMAKAGQPNSGPHVFAHATSMSATKQPELQKKRPQKEVAADVACRSATGYLDAYVEVLNREHSKFLLESADLMKHSSPESRQKRREAMQTFLAR